VPLINSKRLALLQRRHHHPMIHRRRRQVGLQQHRRRSLRRAMFKCRRYNRNIDHSTLSLLAFCCCRRLLCLRFSAFCVIKTIFFLWFFFFPKKKVSPFHFEIRFLILLHFHNCHYHISFSKTKTVRTHILFPIVFTFSKEISQFYSQSTFIHCFYYKIIIFLLYFSNTIMMHSFEIV
jgi:hypothetical protein